MWFFPLCAALVSGLFGALVSWQWRHKRRPSLLAWALALMMFAVASVAAFAGMLWGWTAGWYRTYYLLGAIVNVPVLGLGTIYLLGPRKAAHLCAVVVIVASAAAASAVFASELRPAAAAAFETSGIPSGHDVMPSSIRTLSRIYSFGGFFVVAGGAVWSARQVARQRQGHLRRLVAANVLIAAGTTVVAIGSGFAFYGDGWPFAIGLMAGVSLMFWGFLKTRPQPAPGLEA
jgi:hypothetical protein